MTFVHSEAQRTPSVVGWKIGVRSGIQQVPDYLVVAVVCAIPQGGVSMGPAEIHVDTVADEFLHRGDIAFGTSVNELLTHRLIPLVDMEMPTSG